MSECGERVRRRWMAAAHAKAHLGVALAHAQGEDLAVALAEASRLQGQGWEAVHRVKTRSDEGGEEGGELSMCSVGSVRSVVSAGSAGGAGSSVSIVDRVRIVCMVAFSQYGESVHEGMRA